MGEEEREGEGEREGDTRVIFTRFEIGGGGVAEISNDGEGGEQRRDYIPVGRNAKFFLPWLMMMGVFFSLLLPLVLCEGDVM